MTCKTLLQLAVLPFFALLAVGSSSPKKDGAAADDKVGTTTTTGSVGKGVAIGDAEWTVIDIVNRGTKMKANESFEKDATTTGTFLQIHFKVANTGKKEGTIGDVPKVVDPGGREFGTYENASSFRPKDSTGVFLDKVQPSMSKEFYEIYEVPAGVTTVSLKAHDFGLFGKDKTIALGNIPPAPPAPVAAPAAPAKGGAPAPAAAAKAKAAPAKK